MTDVTDLPALTGTTNQTGWAGEIRAAWLADLARTAEQGRQTMERRNDLDNPGYLAFTASWDEQITAILAAHTDAGWWIARRPVDITRGPGQQYRAGKLSDITAQIKKAAMVARDRATQ